MQILGWKNLAVAYRGSWLYFLPVLVKENFKSGLNLFILFYCFFFSPDLNSCPSGFRPALLSWYRFLPPRIMENRG